MQSKSRLTIPSIIRPYSEELARYLNEENRNIFEYPLDLTHFQKLLIQLHVFELNKINLTYYFHKYNCATFILNVLSVALPSLQSDHTFYLSPADITRAVNHAGLIKSQKFRPSNEWIINSLEARQASENLQLILKHQDETDLKWLRNLSDPVEIELAYRFLRKHSAGRSGILSHLDQWRGETLRQSPLNFTNLIEQNNPLKNPSDSVFSSSMVYKDSDLFVRFSITPASHLFRTIRPGTLSDSELRIGEVSFDIALDGESIRLNELILYSATSRKAGLTGNTQALEVSYTQILDKYLYEVGTFNIRRGVGKTFKFGRNITSYTQINFALGGTKQKAFLETEFQSGLLLDFDDSAKFLFEYALKRNNLLDHTRRGIRLEFSFALHKNSAVFFTANRIFGTGVEYNSFDIGIDLHF